MKESQKAKQVVYKKNKGIDDIIMNPYKEIVSKISPLEFEHFCLTIIKQYAESEKLNAFSITHNKKIRINDEDFQIDVFAEFIALNVKFNVIIECKHQKRSVERDEIIILNDKVNNLAAHKGILVSTSGFQSGAIKRATKNGIALLQIMDKSVRFVQASIPIELDKRIIEYEKQLPAYFAFQYSGNIPGFPDKQIYPTKYMEAELRLNIEKQFGDNGLVTDLSIL